MVNQAFTPLPTQIERLKTIFYWQSTTHSHCLLRIYSQEANGQTVVVLSDMASNQDNPGFSRDLTPLAQAIAQTYRDQLGDDLDSVIWLEHYGRFSEPLSYTTLYDPESFVKHEFDWEGTHPSQRHSAVYEVFELEALLPWLSLSDVEQDLQALATRETDARS